MKRNKKAYIVISFIFLFAVISIYGCGRSGGKGDILALVGDTKITISSFNERISNLPERYQAIIKKRKDEFLQEVINDTLLFREAVKIGLHKDREVLKVVEEARKKIVIARLLKDKVDDAIRITKESVERYYNENKQKFLKPEILRVSHILVSTREEAKKILEELEGGAVFEDVARARSVDPTAQRGGDIGYFPRGQLMPEFERACTGLEINGISGVVKTKLGYHIIKLTDRRKPEPTAFDQIKKKIRSRLHTVERQKIFNELLSRLREETPIDINSELLSDGLEQGVNAEVKKEE